MTIDEAIQTLRDAKKDGVKHIVLAYWTADMFGRQDDDMFAEGAEHIEDQFDWSYTHESIETFLDIDGDDEEDE